MGATVGSSSSASARSPDDFRRAWNSFILSVDAVARLRAGESASMTSVWLSRITEPLRKMMSEPAAVSVLRALDADDARRPLLSNLTEEMLLYAWAYRDARPAVVEEIPDDIRDAASSVTRSPTDGAGAVSDAEVIFGSIDKILDKLPGPLKKFLHALLEVLKLA